MRILLIIIVVVACGYWSYSQNVLGMFDIIHNWDNPQGNVTRQVVQKGCYKAQKDGESVHVFISKDRNTFSRVREDGIGIYFGGDNLDTRCQCGKFKLRDIARGADTPGAITYPVTVQGR